MPDLRTVAFHEAGHAVVAAIAGARPVHLVTIRPGRGARGRVELEPWPEHLRPDVSNSEETEELIRAEIVCSWGGPYSVRKLLGVFDEESDIGDYFDVMELVTRVAPPGREREYSEECEEEAERLVEEAWPLIEEVATLLLERHELSGDELRELVAAAT